jgi:hypothetical protein
VDEAEGLDPLAAGAPLEVLGQPAPVSEEVNGCRGLQETSVERPLAAPMASMNAGKARALPTEAIRGR